jgi:hypothetical protein
MEFPFDVNFILPYEVTIFNGDYRVLNQAQSTRVSYVVKRVFSILLMFLFEFVVPQKN